MIVETLVAVLVLAIGILTTLGTFATTNSTTLVAQRTETAIHVAQQQLERLRTIPYDDLKISSAPANPRNSNRVTFTSGWVLQTSSGLEPFVNQDSQARGGSLVNPGPDDSSADPSIPPGYKVYRYVTFHIENCGTFTCSSVSLNSKRLTVAVTADPVSSHPNLGPINPIWISTIVTDPSGA